MSDGTLATAVEKHPKMTSVLFVLLFLLTQVGTAAANNGGYVGP